jgi:Flp pilus assembly protein TadD
MSFEKVRGVRHGVFVLMAGILFGAGGAQAQSAQYREDPGEALTRHLRNLNENPRSFDALIGAGRAAIDVGDPQAALAFFGRAEEMWPTDYRVKAGMGSSLVHLEQAHNALRFFEEAKALGAPDLELARDRGLAYDIIGDPRRAQQDYTLLLRSRDDPEVRRRLALSLAISGQRAAAQAVIDPQLRSNDRSAWRAWAFVLALTGDIEEALRAAQSTMPAGQAPSMRRFFERLPQLNHAQRAMAVHFGHFPGDGRPTAAAHQVDTRPYEGALQLAGVDRPPAAQRVAAPAAAPSQPRRSSARQSARSTGGVSLRDRLPSAEVTPVPAAPPQQQRQAAQQPPQVQQVQKQVQKQVQQPVQTPVQPAQPQQRPTAAADQPQAPERQFADLASFVQAIEDSPPPATQPARAVPPAAPAAKAVPAHPPRHWVQVAGGANKEMFPGEYRRLRSKAPQLLSDKTVWTAPLRFTNRLLVGPFASQREAQEFVNELAKFEISAFSWTSEAGQEIEQLVVR